MSVTYRSLLLLAFATSVLVHPGRSDDPVRVPRADDLPPGWSAHSPRDEIRPAFAYDPTGGPNRSGAFVITHDPRAGLQGWVEKEFPAAGGEWVRFGVVRKARNVADTRRSCLVRVRWQDDAGKMVSV